MENRDLRKKVVIRSLAPSSGVIDHDNNLGSPAVVRRILGQFIACFCACEDEDEVLQLIDRVAGIFSGVTPGYLRVPGWECQAGLCYSLAETYGVNDRKYKHHVVRDALAIIAVEVIDMAKENEGGQAGLERGTDVILDKATAALTGSVEILKARLGRS